MTSPPSLIFKRSKNKPSQRTRNTSPEDHLEQEGNDTTGVDESPSTLATKLKTKRSKVKSRLSFGGADEGEEGEEFLVKKSNLSRKLALGKNAAAPLNLEHATISPNRGPSYNQAYLNQLKASTPSARPPFRDADPYDADMSMDKAEVSVVDIDIEDLTIISSESSINVAKEKREHFRNTKTNGEDDFISLSVIQRDDGSQGPHPTSRLVREEDELGDGDDEFAEYTSAQERIALGKKSRKAEASKRRDAMKELMADAEEEDDETIEWEREQLRRGDSRGLETPSSAVEAKEVYKAAPIPKVSPVPSLAPALSRLGQQLSQLTTSHANNTSALNSFAQERSEVDARELELREMICKAEEKRAWFTSFQEWLESVASFLDEKYPLLEKLEDEHKSLLQERHDLVFTRRHAEDDDDLTIIFGRPAISSLQDKDEENPTVDAATRQMRRTARLARHQSRLQRDSACRDEEGYSTDSSLPPSDRADYSTAIQTLTSRKQEVLKDVRAEEFRDPGRGRWSQWREKYSESYISAWGGLGVVSVWEFWARLEMIGWDFIEDSRNLDSFQWYRGLYQYSRPGSTDDDVEERVLGSDGDLVASMISTAVIPQISKSIEEGILDVYSERHVRRIVHLAEEVAASVESASPKFQMLLESVVAVFQRAISDTEDLIGRFQNSGLSSFNPEAIPARRRFLARRIKLLQNLLRWRKYAGEKFELGFLIERLSTRCILVVAETGWEVGGEDMARNAVMLLPKEAIPMQLKKIFHVG